ncbi:hypothetical protein DYB25_009187 [Aphanomyces astaci]|uniref:Protein kinase domain-containing protein n=1 Tax=Aphanomyces astaci TaxID=112090 RepID=A0A397EUC2_APHAT|nr:hypothetical protein DYB25_009187 [Aphanomyces astaci]RHY41729.1 hypothetical protein DYB30_009877 [Aphanomyces astaci]RHY49005.1 hypothetical protein DYB38_009427 [Aphanomyces astaci]RHY67331.1 hypothetical protein DYB34_007468 [Aphanomyces astaci]RHY86300.1 hypothetical protein DYB26_009804 [Aphanomyces astaci]
MNMQQRFTTQRVLSPALYGEILLCHDNATNEQVVIKKIDQGASASRKTVQRQRVVLEDTRFEQFVNKTLHEEGGHPNVLTMQTMFAADGYDHFVFEYCNRGALFDVMEDATDKQLDVMHAERYFLQILTGLKFIHAAGFAHRDLSLENVLVDSSDTCKICDFGLAVDINSRPIDRVGKPYYIAPEVFDNVAPYDPSKADVWSLGIILFLLLTGVPLVNLPSKMDESYVFLSRFGLKKLIQGWELEDFVSDDAANLLEKMLCINPNQRCTLQEVAQHPYVLRRT